jgi:hypothetical protein
LSSAKGRLAALGLAVLVAAGISTPLLVDSTPSASPTHAPTSGHPANATSTPKVLTRLVATDVDLTVSSGSYDMTFNDTATPAPGCSVALGESGIQSTGPKKSSCSSDLLPSISGHGTVDTKPYAMVAISQDGPLGQISLYDNGIDIWEVGGGDYGLAGPGSTGPGAPLPGYAGSVEGTVGLQAGALDMQSLASGTGYLDLEAAEIQGAQPAGTGTVDGVPVTIYKLSMTGLQDPNLAGLTPQQVETIREADGVLQQTGFPGKTALISVDAAGYIREVHTTYTLSDGSSVDQDSVFSNFGCAGTVLMPGQSGSSAPPAGCVSPDNTATSSSS